MSKLQIDGREVGPEEMQAELDRQMHEFAVKDISGLIGDIIDPVSGSPIHFEVLGAYPDVQVYIRASDDPSKEAIRRLGDAGLLHFHNS